MNFLIFLIHEGGGEFEPNTMTVLSGPKKAEIPDFRSLITKRTHGKLAQKNARRRSDVDHINATCDVDAINTISICQRDRRPASLMVRQYRSKREGNALSDPAMVPLGTLFLLDIMIRCDREHYNDNGINETQFMPCYY